MFSVLLALLNEIDDVFFIVMLDGKENIHKKQSYNKNNKENIHRLHSYKKKTIKKSFTDSII
jgi:hypothetical protein